MGHFLSPFVNSHMFNTGNTDAINQVPADD